MAKEIAILIPCYNEEKRIKTSSFISFIKENEELIDFYFVNDGSTDLTSDIIKHELINEKNCFLIDLERNLGKGNAIREGFSGLPKTFYSYVGFIDADLQIPLDQILKLYLGLKDSQFKMAISVRRFSVLKNLNLRGIGSRTIVFLANKIIDFDLPIRDTQCGCKLMTKEVAELCFLDSFISKWLFDIEIFLRLKATDPLARMAINEIQVKGLERGGNSKFKLWENTKILKQLLSIKSFYN